MQQAAFDRGSFATLLGIVFWSNWQGAHVFAIGDTIVAFIDGSQVLRTIPYAQPEEFDRSPDLLSTGRNISIPVIPQIGAPPKFAPPHAYIGAFSVVDGKNFDAVLALVGDKIELVGQIVSVKQGIGKRGRGRDRPYVFINFGIWSKNSVKITIWSEGLENMSGPPTEAWVGKWISVTGLIEPPYEGKHYGKPYRSVGITVTSDNQIIHISDQEAKFRLGGRRAPLQSGAADRSTPKNTQILDDIRRGSILSATTMAASTTRAAQQSPYPDRRKHGMNKSLEGCKGRLLRL